MFIFAKYFMTSKTSYNLAFTILFMVKKYNGGKKLIAKILKLRIEFRGNTCQTVSLCITLFLNLLRKLIFIKYVIELEESTHKPCVSRHIRKHMTL